MAYKEPSNVQTGTTKSSLPFTEHGQTLETDKTSRLSSQDLTVLEQSVRSQVSGLVGALHAGSKDAGGKATRAADIDHRLHPELDERARQMPAMDRAVSYRERFLKALIDPDPRHHRDLIQELLQADIPLQTLAIHLLCPIATELGNYWCDDDADFIQVAVASTRLSNVVHHLTHAGPQPSQPASAKRILLARSHATKHTLGVTLVRMCFRDLGWIVDGGADMEIGETMYMRLSARSYHLLGLSIGQLEEARDCKEAIDRCRSDATTRTMKIAIGGAAVLAQPDGFRHTGADIVAHSALEVIRLAEQFGAAGQSRS
ncbi:cobalamin B12-binding domain-containing protein [Nitratireductor alexandrii]|uniref:cobalamin B12-binding domain-containing protein n=1 Tax=Nitratireductor alexandrii TaxID=2448161 RepID=UPI001EE8E6AE|nr:cobalamin-binding protein [Nitratireductor alexandrii]